MNPIEIFREVLNREIMNGGRPTVCIMGHEAYASLCGALGVLHATTITLQNYNGIDIRVSRAQKHGMMFGE